MQSAIPAELLPLQGGGWEGDGVFIELERHPIPTLALPLKGREECLTKIATLH
jgi:hypothetical protein